MAEKLIDLLCCMWREEAFPHEFKDTFTIHLYKRDPQVCDNHRCISLLSTKERDTGKNPIESSKCAS